MAAKGAATTTPITNRPNLYFTALDEASANDGIVQKVVSSYTTKDKIGCVIRKIELFDRDYNVNRFLAAADGFIFGVMNTMNQGDAITTPADAPGVILARSITRFDAGTAANTLLVDLPIVIEPPAEVLMHPAAIYLSLKGVSQAAALRFYVRMWYDFFSLTDADYEDIIQILMTSAI